MEQIAGSSCSALNVCKTDTAEFIELSAINCKGKK